MQGSVIGPILFIIFINHLDEYIQAAGEGIRIFKYADDSKLLQSIENEMDHHKLQAAIEHLLRWCNDFGMELHPGKCQVVHFGKKNPHQNYFIGHNQIKKADVVKDLGIWVNRNLEPSIHINKIAKKAHAVLSQIDTKIDHTT